jgi:hypothetical protein
LVASTWLATLAFVRMIGVPKPRRLGKLSFRVMVTLTTRL